MGKVVSVIKLCQWQPCTSTNENDYLSQTAVYAQGMQGVQDPIMIGTPFYTTHLLYTHFWTNKSESKKLATKCYLINSPNEIVTFLLEDNANQHLPTITPVSLKRPPRSDWSEDRLLIQVTIQRRRLLALLPLWLDLSLYYALPPFTSLSSYQTVK